MLQQMSGKTQSDSRAEPSAQEKQREREFHVFE